MTYDSNTLPILKDQWGGSGAARDSAADAEICQRRKFYKKDRAIIANDHGPFVSSQLRLGQHRPDELDSSEYSAEAYTQLSTHSVE